MNKDELKREVVASEVARKLKSDLDGYIMSMEQDCYEVIKQSNFLQKSNREEAYKMLRAIDLFSRKLKKNIDKGKMAKHKLQQLS